MNSKEYLEKAESGFQKLSVDNKYKTEALKNLKVWLSEKQYADYSLQIKYIIDQEDWDYLLDCFYQVIPFGTGGRRGEVGVGPNRINKWAIQASAQGHSQYLLKIYNDEVKTRGVVLAYGVREFFGNKHYDNSIPNPLKNLKGKDLALAAAEVYLANNIKTYIFDAPRTTPELSFSIRHLNALAGDMFDASHNPPEHNGKKVYDEFGGQLVPPYDELLVKEVTENVKEIKTTDIDTGIKNGFYIEIGKEVDDAFIKNIVELSLSDKRDIKIVFTPLHGVGMTSVKTAMELAGFKVLPDPSTNNQSGKFENITFNIPNPEVRESFDTTLIYAKKVDADLILNSDPDADRIGLMVKHKESWEYLNGNEIGSILTRFVIEKKKSSLIGKGVVVKTSVTTNLASQICKANDVEMIGELLVGFKYIGEVMNTLEKEGRIDNFLLGLEESHGYIAGNYIRDKDAAIAAVWISELAAELKIENKTLIDYMNETYFLYGYFRNYLTEIRLPGAEGMTKIRKIQDNLREMKPDIFEDYKVERFEDFLDRKPIVSETDKQSKDVLVFHLKPSGNLTSIKITVRGSGTEPKIKMYYEIGSNPTNIENLSNIKNEVETHLSKLEKAFMKYCYKVIDVDFPDRGFLLFWQLPLKDKLRYFEIEPEIERLTGVNNLIERKEKLFSLLDYLGSNPVEKVDKAFKEKNSKGILNYLSIK